MSTDTTLGRTLFDARQLAAYREALAHGYLHLRYRDQRESLRLEVYGPLVRAWEFARYATGAAVIAVESYADSPFAEVTYAALESPLRTELDAARARAVAELERLVRPVVGALARQELHPVQLCWFSKPLAIADAEALARRAVELDQWLLSGRGDAA